MYCSVQVWCTEQTGMEEVKNRMSVDLLFHCNNKLNMDVLSNLELDEMLHGKWIWLCGYGTV